MNRLWQALARHMIETSCRTGVVDLACDDPLFHHDGRKVEGAGVFRDAVRSTIGRVVYARGLYLVVITLRVAAPWGGQPIALPVNVRLHRENDATATVEHAAATMRELVAWLPERFFHLCADGAYATLAGAGLPRTHLTSRMRRDAALFQAAHHPPGDVAGPAPRGSGCPPHQSSPPRRPGSGTGRRPPSTSAAGPSNAWSTSVTCPGTGSTNTTWSVWSSSATPAESNRTTSSSQPTAPSPAPRSRLATQAAGPSTCASATSSRTPADGTRNRGNGADPNVPPACRCGCTPWSGARTLRPIPAAERGPTGLGTGTRRPRASSMHPPRPMVQANYNHVPLQARRTENHRGVTRHARLRRIDQPRTAEVRRYWLKGFPQ